jgi:MFS family permease
MAQEATRVETDAPSETVATRRPSTFHSLQYRDFRYLWMGQLGAASSQWMENVARPFLILELTDSELLVGLIAATRMLPMLFLGAWAGVLADRVDKKRILLASQAVTFTTHAVTAALILTGVIEPWMVFVGTLTGGTAQAFNQPARVSLIGRLVPRENVTNAIALTSAGFNTMRAAGPIVASVVLALFSFGDLYLLQALLLVWVLWNTLQISVPLREARKRTTSMGGELIEGFKAVRDDKPVLYILVMSLVIFVWAMPFQGVFVPLIGKKELGLSASEASLLFSVVGLGALSGSLIIATFGDRLTHRGFVMLGIMGVFSLSLLVFANAGTLLLVVPALALTGAMQVSFMSLNNAFVLSHVPPDLHGRILGLFHLDRGLVPAGAALGGVLASTLDPSAAQTIMAVVCLVSATLMALLFPALRNIS